MDGVTFMGWTMGFAAFCYRKSKVLPLSSQRQCTPRRGVRLIFRIPSLSKFHKNNTIRWMVLLFWGGRWDSNPRSSEPQSDALAN